MPMRASSGAINDGRARNSLAPLARNLSCSWIITPADLQTEPRGYFIISFNYASFGPGDTLSIFEGAARRGATLITELRGAYNLSQVAAIRVTVKKSAFVQLLTTASKPLLGRGLSGFELSWQACGHVCLSCTPGQRFLPASDDDGGGACVACSSPNVTYERGQLECVPCPPLFEWISPSECRPCGAGFLFAPEQRKCQPCPPQQYRDDPETQRSCVSCPSGFIAVNHTSCANCSEGQRPRSGADVCEPIPVPDVPQNNGVVIIYVVVGLVVLLLVGVVIAYFQWRKSRQEDNFGYEPIALT